MVVEILNLCTYVFIHVYLESRQVSSMTEESFLETDVAATIVCLANITHRKLLGQKIKGRADMHFQHMQGRFKAGT